jgi:hypothetical protein
MDIVFQKFLHSGPWQAMTFVRVQVGRLIPRSCKGGRVIDSFDTAGEVLAALVRCLGVEKVWCSDVEVYDASPDADRTHPI